MIVVYYMGLKLNFVKLGVKLELRLKIHMTMELNGMTDNITS